MYWRNSGTWSFFAILKMKKIRQNSCVIMLINGKYWSWVCVKLCCRAFRILGSWILGLGGTSATCRARDVSAVATAQFCGADKKLAVSSGRSATPRLPAVFSPVCHVGSKPHFLPRRNGPFSRRQVQFLAIYCRFLLASFTMTQTITETYVRDAVEHSAGEEDEEEEEDIAVQRDFLIPADCDSRLKPYGGRLLADQVLTDEFYDRKDFALSLGGITLRSRDGDWELSLEERKGEDGKTANRILRDVGEIGEFLHSKSLIKERGLGGDTKEALRREGFEIFAKSSVTRKVSIFVDWLIDWLIDVPSSWSVDWLIDWFSNRLILVLISYGKLDCLFIFLGSLGSNRGLENWFFRFMEFLAVCMAERAAVTERPFSRRKSHSTSPIWAIPWGKLKCLSITGMRFGPRCERLTCCRNV